HARSGARPACSLDLPQGLPKKIQFNLLLTDLALQLGNTIARELKLRHRHVWYLRPNAPRTRPVGFARSATTAQCLGATRSEPSAPKVQILARNLHFARQGSHILARQHPANDHQLEISTEDTGCFGHQFPL